VAVDETTGRQYIMSGVDSFEWDNDKTASNLVKHGVSFEEATRVFDDPFAIEELDDRKAYGELRFSLIGMAGNRVLKVIYTERGERMRIISARKATKHEREYYYR
jgi:uncharacterized DUF497 family protein